MTGPFKVLLVEDDDGDALLVEELLTDAEETFVVSRATSVAAARRQLRGADCALVDLGLPDAHGLDALQALRADAPDIAFVVLTGSNDRLRGLAALGAGAQDYLVKGMVDGRSLARSIRYAVERRRAEIAQLRLLLAERRQSENARLARGLLPRLDLDDAGVRTATRYQPGGADALLGGDFFDALALPDGTVRAVVGDVSGHGPDEAALGVAMRIAWRTSTLAGAEPVDVLRGMDAVLRHERHDAHSFATVCEITLDADQRACTVRLHGHPPPLLVSPTVGWMPTARPSTPLGIGTFAPAPEAGVPLDERWALVLLTDGIYEARHRGGRLDMEGLVSLAATVPTWTEQPDAALDTLIALVASSEGSSLDDDVAMMWLGART